MCVCLTPALRTGVIQMVHFLRVDRKIGPDRTGRTGVNIHIFFIIIINLIIIIVNCVVVFQPFGIIMKLSNSIKRIYI